MKDVVNFLFEMGILSKTPRSGFHFLGTGEQSVSEHILRTIFVGYSLASLHEDVDINKVLKMCLFHDIAEARTSDPNYVYQKYVKIDEEKALEDMTKNLSFGKDINEILDEYFERKTKESIIAKEADVIELLLSLKEQLDIGNKKVEHWIPLVVKRLKTTEGKKMADEILKTGFDEWWFGDRKGDWWVNRNEKSN